MTLRAVIVDDEPVARRRLRTLLRAEPGVEVIGECEDGSAAIDMIRHLQPDLVFLDVQMPGLDGFDVIEALEVRELPAVVFVTAYDQYAVRAFDVHAADCLLKPFARARLRRAIEHVEAFSRGDRQPDLQAVGRAVQASRPLSRFLVKSAGRVYAVRADAVESIEAAGHYVELHAAGSTHLVRESIAVLERRLDSQRFVRIHRSAIVNVDRVRELQPMFHGEFVVLLPSGRRLRCSRTYAKELTEALGS